MSATPRINDLAALESLRLREISSKPRLYSRGIQVGGKTTLLNERGEVFHSSVSGDRAGRLVLFRFVPPWLQGEILKALFLLGYVSAEVKKSFDRQTIKRRLQSTARDHLRYSGELAKIGVPFTDEQIKKLRRIEKGEEP